MLLAQSRFEEAIDVLETELSAHPAHTEARCDLALTWYCLREQEKAQAELDRALAEQPDNVQALCTKALFLQDKGDTEGALQQVRSLHAGSLENMDDLHRTSLTFMELGAYDEARSVLREMERQYPYDTGILHRIAVCSYAQGEYEEACRCYDILLKVDGADSIARYYRRLCRKALAGEVRREGLPAQYQVPMDEVVQRIRRLNAFICKPQEVQKAEWHCGSEMMELIRWCFTLADDGLVTAALNLVALFDDMWSERILRGFILQREPGQALKRKALALLKHMGAEEPYLAYIDGEMMESRVSLLPGMPADLPLCYGEVIRVCMEAMEGSRPDGVMLQAGNIWNAYVRRGEPLPNLTDAQIAAMAAALEYLACQAEDVSMTKLEACRKYHVSMLRFNGALAKLNGKENHT